MRVLRRGAMSETTTQAVFWRSTIYRAGGIEALIRRAEELRALRLARTPHATRPGRVLGMVFEKASTRTRASFEIAMYDLGGHALYLGMQGSQLERGEPLRDTARVLSGYCHGIMVRTFGHDRADEMSRYATVPVINGLTDLMHPCQVLADLQTVVQRFGGTGAADTGRTLRSVSYAWIGDGNNMANSWIEAAGILGLDLALACPAGYDPDPGVLARARARQAGAHHRGPRSGRGRRRSPGRLHRRFRLDGAGGRGRRRAARRSPATPSTARSCAARTPTRSSCIASPPTGARRSATR